MGVAVGVAVGMAGVRWTGMRLRDAHLEREGSKKETLRGSLLGWLDTPWRAPEQECGKKNAAGGFALALDTE
jgi:hypothetical protein